MPNIGQVQMVRKSSKSYPCRGRWRQEFKGKDLIATARILLEKYRNGSAKDREIAKQSLEDRSLIKMVAESGEHNPWETLKEIALVSEQAAHVVMWQAPKVVNSQNVGEIEHFVYSQAKKEATGEKAITNFERSIRERGLQNGNTRSIQDGEYTVKSFQVQSRAHHFQIQSTIHQLAIQGGDRSESKTGTTRGDAQISEPNFILPIGPIANTNYEEIGTTKTLEMGSGVKREVQDVPRAEGTLKRTEEFNQKNTMDAKNHSASENDENNSVEANETKDQSKEKENTKIEQGTMPQNKVKKREGKGISVSKKQHVIETYTCEDIISTRRIGKLYDHPTGPFIEEKIPIAQKNRVKEKGRKPKTRKKENKVRGRKKSKSYLKEREKQKKEKETKRTETRRNDDGKKESKEDGKKRRNKSLRRKKQKKERKAGKRTDVKKVENKERIREISRKIGKLKKAKKEEKDVKKKELIDQKIKKLREQKLKAEEKLNKKLRIRGIKVKINRMCKKIKDVLKRIKRSKQISRKMLRDMSKKELERLKRLLKNKKIIMWLLMGAKPKRRKSILKRIKELLKKLRGQF